MICYVVGCTNEYVKSMWTKVSIPAGEQVIEFEESILLCVEHSPLLASDEQNTA